MSENQACQSQVHVTALRYLRGKPRRRGLNKRLKPGLRRWGGTGSHTLPNHVTRKQTVNATLARGHHAQTRRTARNFFNLIYNSSTPNKTVHYYFFIREDDIARFNSITARF
jgi:hypothetical protein